MAHKKFDVYNELAQVLAHEHATIYANQTRDLIDKPEIEEKDMKLTEMILKFLPWIAYVVKKVVTKIFDVEIDDFE